MKKKLDLIKDIPIAGIAVRLGLKFDRNFNTPCLRPKLHANGDQHPSLHLNTENNCLHCFVCGLDIDGIDLVKMVRNCSFQEACDFIIGGKMSQNKSNTKSTKNVLDNHLSKKEHELANNFHQNLSRHFDDLKKDGKIPGFWTESVVKKLRVGWDGNLSRLTFSNFDAQNHLVNVQWHKLKSLKGRGTTTLFPAQLIKKYDKNALLVLCEGNKDTVTVIRFGFQAVTSTNGAQSIPKDLSSIADFREVVIVYDHDKAGQLGAIKLAHRLKKDFPDLTVKIFSWDDDKPQGYDVTDYFEEGEKKDDFNEMLKNAKEFIINNSTDDDKIFNRTDAGNAELFVNMHGKYVKYEHQSGKIYLWNGQFWEIDIKNHIYNMGIETVRKWRKIAMETLDLTLARELFNHALKSEQKKRIQYMLELVKSMPQISTTSSDWNQDIFLLQFNNCTLDLITMKSITGDPNNLISFSVGYDYDPNGQCPRFKQALQEIFNNDSQMIRFIQRAVGYSLTGDISEQCFLLCYGTGANGKTVLLEIFKLLMGDYGLNTMFSTFEKKSGNSIPNDIARLQFARLVTASESGINKTLDEERLKVMTGEDSVTARFLYHENFTFNPRYKLWLAVNTLPMINDFSFGFWRRVRLIPFERLFIGKNADPKLLKKLKTELPGIMNWALEGFKQWQRSGLRPPQKVIQATRNFNNDADVVKEFIENNTIRNPKVKIGAKELYDNFMIWFKSEYSSPGLSQAGFAVRMKLLTGLKSKRDGKKRRKTYFGIDMVKNFSSIFYPKKGKK